MCEAMPTTDSEVFSFCASRRGAQTPAATALLQTIVFANRADAPQRRQRVGYLNPVSHDCVQPIPPFTSLRDTGNDVPTSMTSTTTGGLLVRAPCLPLVLSTPLICGDSLSSELDQPSSEDESSCSE